MDYDSLTPRVSINREIYTVKEFDNQFKLNKDDVPTREKLKTKCRNECKCTSEKAKNTFFGILPFILILKNYQWKQWLFWDVLSGISVGVIHIPQGMGFALLTSLPPVFGLYSSLFPIFIYFFFATSKHISMGTMAVTSLMIGDIVDKQTELYKAELQTQITTMFPLATTAEDFGVTTRFNQTADNTEDEIEKLIIDYKVQIACAVTLTMGIVHFGMSFLRLGIVATFMSSSFIGGFLSGCAVHIGSSQFKFLFGLSFLAKRSGMLKVPLMWYDVLSHLPECNPADIVISVICIAFLVFFKEFFNPKFIHKIKVPIPAELLLVILATVVSYLGKLEERFNVRIVKHIPPGFPNPRVPPIGLMPAHILDCILVALVAFAINISMAKLMATKHKYKIDQNQELFAYGMVNVISSFFNAFGGAQAPPRTLVHDRIGGKTQLGSLVSCIMLLLVILFLGPLFESLPNAALASIILVALFPLFKAFADLKPLFIKNKSDCFTWAVTCAVAVFLDVVYGLIIGLLFSLFTIVLQSHLAKTRVVEPIHDSADIVVPKKKYHTDNKFSGVKIFRFESALHFANADKCKYDLYAKVLDPNEMTNQSSDSDPSQTDANTDDISFEKSEDITIATDLTDEKSVNKNKLGTDDLNINENNTSADDNNSNKQIKSDENGSCNSEETLVENAIVPHTIVLDMQAVVYIDVNGMNVLKQIKDDYKSVGIQVVLANCCSEVLSKLYVAGVLNPEEDEGVYVTVLDAVRTFNAPTDTSRL